MSGSPTVLLLRLDRLDPESGLFASFADPPRVPLLRFAPLPIRGPSILKAIGALDENAARLLLRFRKRFPKVYEAVEAIGAGLPDGEERSLFFFLSVCSIALQIEEADVREAASVPSGVQVDYTLFQDGEQWFVDTRTTLRSLWSYRLAEVPTALLLHSLFASLGETLGTFAGRCGELLQTRTLRLSGDLPANPFLQSGLRRGLPRTFAVEGAAGSEPLSAEEPATAGPSSAGPAPFAPPAAPAAEGRAPDRAED